MTADRQNWFEGWRLFAVLTLTLVALCLWIAGMRRLRGRRRADGDPLHRADLAVVLLPRLRRRGAGAAMAECVDAVAAPQPPLSRRHLCRLARHPRGRHCLLRGDGSRGLRGSDQHRLVYFRRHRLCLHHRHDRDLVRPHRGSARRAGLAHAASGRRLLSAVSVHGVVRQADSRHAALRAVPDPAAGGVRAAHDRDGAAGATRHMPASDSRCRSASRHW